MRKALFAGALAALTLAAGVAVAQQSPDPPQARALRADADGDRRLSRAEFVDARIARLAAADADRDGSVTREEMRAARQDRRAAPAEAGFDHLDADDDGLISKAEFEARREHRVVARAGRGSRRAHRGPHRGPGRAGPMAGRASVVIAEARARTEAGFTRMDADSDGYITVAERQTARARRREQRDERMAGRRAARRAHQASPPAPASE